MEQQGSFLYTVVGVFLIIVTCLTFRTDTWREFEDRAFFHNAADEPKYYFDLQCTANISARNPEWYDIKILFPEAELVRYEKMYDADHFQLSNRVLKVITLPNGALYAITMNSIETSQAERRKIYYGENWEGYDFTRSCKIIQPSWLVKIHNVLFQLKHFEARAYGLGLVEVEIINYLLFCLLIILIAEFSLWCCWLRHLTWLDASYIRTPKELVCKPRWLKLIVKLMVVIAVIWIVGMIYSALELNYNYLDMWWMENAPSAEARDMNGFVARTIIMLQGCGLTYDAAIASFIASCVGIIYGVWRLILTKVKKIKN